MKILFLAALFVFGANTAGAVDYNCEGCSVSQMHAKALSLGRGEHRLFSFSNNTAKTFTVSCSNTQPTGTSAPDSVSGSSDRSAAARLDPAASGCPLNGTLQVQMSPLQADEQHAFDLAKQFLDVLPPNDQGAELTYDASTHPGNSPYGDSVYNVLNDYPARMNLIRDMKNDIPFLTQYTTALAAALVAHFNVLSNRIIISVTFRDGSSLRFIYDGNLQTVTPIPGTARNNVGNVIVEANDSGYQGTYNVVGTDVEAYLRYLQSLGIRVVRGPTGLGRVRCVWEPSTHSLTCSIS